MTKQPDNKRQDHYPVYINPLTDFGIKKLFCSDARGAERLLSLLRAFLPDRMKDVKSISFNPTELLGADESTNLYSDKILFCFLELSKFAAPKIGQLKDMNFPDDRHKWAYILKHGANGGAGFVAGGRSVPRAVRRRKVFKTYQNGKESL